jgi:GNAT superfamily N-acetyltransferase
MLIFEKRKENFLVSTNKELLDLKLTHKMLSESYWATKIPESVFKKSVDSSLCFGIYDDKKQVGFARVVSDFATFAYLADVFVVPEYQGRGLSKFLMEVIMQHPELQGLRRFCLGTKDAHGLYEKFGFKVIKEPQNWMEIKIPGIYLK